VILQAIAKCILRLCGWTTTGQVPDLDKVVFIAAPHTSNWDGFWLIVFKVALNVRLQLLAKHTLFWWPLGAVLRRIGAIPIDRGHTTSTVQQLVSAFEKEEHLFLALAPEGTRTWKPYWKTGFYQIALAADVPVFLAYIDYPRKRMGIGPEFRPGGDIEHDLAILREFYAPYVARHPELQSPIDFPPEFDSINSNHGER
jgi:1-acyl-sn-glycerol-3-phosphate acyltransferase